MPPTTQEVATVTKKLDAAVDRAVAMIAAYNKQMDKVNSWWIPGCLVLGAVCGSMIGAFMVDFAHDHPGFLRAASPVSSQEVPKKPMTVRGTP